MRLLIVMNLPLLRSGLFDACEVGGERFHVFVRQTARDRLHDFVLAFSGFIGSKNGDEALGVPIGDVWDLGHRSVGPVAGDALAR